MGTLAAILSGPSGKASTMRGATLLVVICIMGTWTAVSVKKWELQKLDAEQVALVLGAMGLKAYQRAGETKQPAVTPQA